MAEPEENAFVRQAREKPPGFWADLFHFIAHNKKWWLTPIILLLLLVSALIVLGGSGVAPFIYSLF
jgi:hypothetical protein